MTGRENTETEVKLWVADLESVEKILISQGAVLAAPRVFECNVRYDHPVQNLNDRGVVLRLRQDSRARLTYKEAGEVKNGVISRFEAEVEVGDFAQMDLILGKLGYVHDVAYEKYRTTYHIDGCEVVLDELPFGKFVEIEGDHDEILRLIQRLSLSEAMRVEMSYIKAFFTIRDVMGFTFTDATFENFANIHVPDEARDWLA